MSLIFKKTLHLLSALVLLLISSTTFGTQISYLSGDLAPQTNTGAGHFDGTTLYLDVTNPTSSTWNSASATASLITGSESISISGSVITQAAGEGAYSSFLVPFTLIGSPVSYLLSQTSSANPNEGGFFNSASLFFGIFDLQIFSDTGYIYLNKPLPLSGTISNVLLGSNEAFFLSGYAFQAKNPSSSSPSLFSANYSVSFMLNPDQNSVPEPSSFALLGLGLVGIVVFRQLKRSVSI